MVSYVITWYCNALKPSKKSKYVVDLGFCEYGKEIAFITEPHEMDSAVTMDSLKPMIVHDIIVEDGCCGDAEWCLNLSCSLNRVDVDYWRERKLLRKNDGVEELRRLHSSLQGMAEDLELSSKDMGVVEFYPEPPVYYVKIKGKKS